VLNPLLQRVQRIIDLEERQSWRNRGVVGGMQAMAERWSEEANAEGLDPRLVAALAARMRRYGAASAEDRPAIAADMRGIMAGAPFADEPPAVAPPGAEALATAPAPAATAARTGAPAAVDSASGVDPAALVETALEIPAGDEEVAAPPNAAPAIALPGLGKVYEAAPDDDFSDPESRRTQRKPPPANRRNPRDLQSNVTILDGVGPATAEQLARLGIHQVADLLWHFPARYDDFSDMRTIDRLRPGEQVTVVANLWEVRERKLGVNRSMVEGILGDSTGTLHAVWWNKWVVKQLEKGKSMRFSGKIDLFRGQKTIENPVFEELDDDRVATGRMSPIYPLTEGLTNNRLRNLIYDAVEGYARFMTDPLPAQLREQYELPDLTYSLQQIHFPDSQEVLLQARRRLAFEELLYLQIGVLQRRRTLRQATAPAFAIDLSAMQHYLNILPFAPTDAQERVIGEILRDLELAVPMTRLVQGDVGSGKTAVAAAAMWTAVNNGAQAALLAPTQVLAEQHHRGIQRLLSQLTRPDGTPVNVQLLTGRVTGDARAEVLDGLRAGAVDVIIGTTALIQEGVDFASLGLVVVDEQHRFGVEQRGVLRSRGETQPHLLVMSATPIPRSLALTLFGDLDVSRIDEMPPGRQEIKTKLFRPRERERLYDFIRREVRDGRQAYIVYPLVEESEVLDAGAAVAEHKRLQEEIFPTLRLGLLHGRMTGAEKDEVMRAFAAGDVQVLVSTTVIEVGIDVPNATIIVIEDAERFGLAQLHQLRGRVGRGAHASYCALITKAEAPEVTARLEFLASNHDGFVLAEKDLELRGPGDFLGTRQSGLPDLRIAQLSDVTTLVQARDAAQQLFDQDPLLSQHPVLWRQVDRFWRGHGDIN
jgi:ATP-dependent DNA helicase RecG